MQQFDVRLEHRVQVRLVAVRHKVGPAVDEGREGRLEDEPLELARDAGIVLEDLGEGVA